MRSTSPHGPASLHIERSPTTPDTSEEMYEVCGFGDVLSPVIFTARDNLTSELLRFLSRVAASKPTSWLSVFPHILDHSARTSGP
jgi:hypothetical protein